MNDLVLLFIMILALSIIANIAFSTLRYGISPTPSNAKMRHECQVLLEKIQIEHGASFRTSCICIAGSGWGGLGLDLAKQTKKPVICYEAAFVPWLWSKFYIWLYRCFKQDLQIQYLRQNFFKIRFPDQSIVVAYLYPGGIQQLFRKLKAEGNVIGLCSIAFAVNESNAALKQISCDWLKTPVYWYFLSEKNRHY